MKIVVVSPHRDDAAFSLGLTVGTWLQQGHAVEIVDVFTRTEYAPFFDADSLHQNDRMSFVSAVRKREDEAWVKMYVGQLGRGKLSLTDLNLKDAPLRLHCSLDEVLTREPDLTEKVTHKIKHALEQSRADAIVLPLGVGNHVDHMTARTACLPTDAQAFSLAFYEDLPYAARAPQTIEAAVQATSLAAAVPLSEAFVSEPTDVDVAVKRKFKLALCYDSQMDDAGLQQVADFSGQYEGRERLWVNAAWRTTWAAAASK
jgi:LmbE family N-acetylglucosaminyl deacetylase